ncbi:MAG: 3-hydroxyacyl-ACP dehydratase FabZ family protein [Sandaracinaceae bacterium]
MSAATKLALGADAVTHLLPHRRPFLFLDGITTFSRLEPPTLTGFKHVSVNEPVFEGHFPGLSLWPGVYTIEGLGQAVNALLVLLAIVEGFERHGRSEQDALNALRNLDKRLKLAPRAVTEAERALVEHLGSPSDRVGLAGSIDVRLVEPVFAGSRIDYRVSLTHALANARRFDVVAEVDGRPVAQGAISSALPATFVRAR